MLRFYYIPKITHYFNFNFNKQLICAISNFNYDYYYSASLNDNYMNKIISRIISSPNPREALNYFNSIKVKIDVINNRSVYSSIIHVLSKGKMYLEARCLMKCLIQDLLVTVPSHRVGFVVFTELSKVKDCAFSRNVFGILMIAFTEMGLVDEAVWVYRKVRGAVSTQACNAVLNGLVKWDRIREVWGMYEEMVGDGLVSSVHTYGTLIDACGSDFVKGKMFFDEMVRKGIKPTVVIFTTFIRGFCDEGRMLEGEDLFRVMREYGVAPNLYTYNVLIDGYCKTGNLRYAMKWFREMLGENVRPNVVTFGILVDAFCKDGEFCAARAFFPCMMKAGVFPNVFVYNSLFDGLCKAGHLSEALGLYLEMGKFYILADVFTYSILVKGLSEAGRVAEADDLLSMMKSCGIPANSVTYNSLIDGYCKQGDFEKARSLFTLMTKEGISPNALTFSPLIHGYCREGNMEAAKGVHLEMMTKNIASDVITYTVLINGYFKNHDTDAALGIYKEMQEAGVRPNAFTISCLIDGLCKDGRVDDAFKHFLEFTSSRNQFDVNEFPVNHISYTALIHRLCMEGRIFRASKIFSDMRVCGERADQLTYRIFISGCAKANHVHSLLMLHAEVYKLGFLPDEFIDPFLYAAYREIENVESDLRCLEHVPSSGIEQIPHELL